MTKETYELHRSEAIFLLLKKIKTPNSYTNIALAECLEEYWPEKNRMYIVREDHISLKKNALTAKTF